MKRFNIIGFLFISAFLLARNGETKLAPDAPKVFIDCEDCDMDYIKREIPYVNYVIERKEADIFVLITKQTTAGEGYKWTIIFTGQNLFSGLTDTLNYYTSIFDSDEKSRNGLVRKLKIGLVRYLAKTPLADKILITLPEEKIVPKPYDPWHNWVFNISLSTYFQGQQRYNFNTINTSLSINKVVEDWKTLNSLSYFYRYNIYKVEDTVIINESKSYSGSTNLVIGLGHHLSLGSYLSFYSSTYENISISGGIGPALEYNIFPYEQSSLHKLTLQYDLSYIYFEYFELTIYDKLKEKLFKEAISLNAYIRQPWGSLDVSLSGSHYFHDFKKNRLTLYTDVSLPILERLSFKVYSYVSMIHDQLSLPKRELTEEEIILQKRILATQYSYYVSIGISYTFGSIYSNIVNPRFGN